MAGAVQSVIDSIYPENPLTKTRHFHLVPEAVEFWLGDHQYTSMIVDEGGIWDHSKYKAMFNDIVRDMVPYTKHEHFPWQISLINRDQMNAWAMPGGKLAIYRKLIEAIAAEENDFGYQGLTIQDKYAAVVGHEMVHPSANHTAKQIAFTVYTSVFRVFLIIFLPGLNTELLRTISEMFLLSRGRNQELEADQYGMQIMHQAGYNPKAALWLQQFLHVHGGHERDWGDWFESWFSTHPTNLERLEANKITLAKMDIGY